jgi:hypothetical protein
MGAPAFTNNAYYITPAIAAGKGFGDLRWAGPVMTPRALLLCTRHGLCASRAGLRASGFYDAR